ncbi:hypothetical protein D3C87_1863800 [compost metagenome]
MDMRMVRMMTRQITAEMGRVKNGLGSPLVSSSPRLRLRSSRSPRMMPSTSGAMGYFISRRMKPTMPKPTMTQTSNMRWVMAKDPTTQST